MNIKEIDGKNVRGIIEIDNFPISPREDDNLGTLCLNHSKYIFMNEEDIDFSEFSSWDEILEYLEKEYNISAILPVYGYDHGGLDMNTKGYSCKWDSMQLGFIFVTKEKLVEEELFAKPRREIEKYLDGEIKEYNQYSNGEIYSFIIEDKLSGEVVDSCSGFYDLEYCILETQNTMDLLDEKPTLEIEIENGIIKAIHGLPEGMDFKVISKD